ncbi:DUF5131 family protein [Opitutaceae bacterium TAV4]|nr:DUF5131 family protein [Opitutaceae bacterium TAV4]RRK02378.1 DUF5131 family protein [Opitutaceae bacterium TAV3]
MAKDSKIEWTDHTFNPWIGCTKVSPGCANCYAAAQDAFRHWTPEGFGKGKPRKRTSEANWRQVLKWDRDAEQKYSDVLAATKYGHVINYTRPRVFCASLADWLDPEVPAEWLADLLDLIRRTPNLDWLLLTKRPELWRERMLDVIWHELAGNGIAIGDAFQIAASRGDKPIARICGEWVLGTAPANVWIGTTTESQAMADKRIPELLRIPARVRFLSVEPMLGPVRLRLDWLYDPRECTCYEIIGGHQQGCAFYGKTASAEMARPWPTVDWVICGCESGPRRRPMDTAHALSLRHQVTAAGVAFFMKQMEVGGKVTSDISLFPPELRVREFPEVQP